MPALEHAERADTGVPALLNVGHSVTDLDDRLYGRHPPLAHEKTGCQKADKSSIFLLWVCVLHWNTLDLVMCKRYDINFTPSTYERFHRTVLDTLQRRQGKYAVHRFAHELAYHKRHKPLNVLRQLLSRQQRKFQPPCRWAN